jgi:uncharacterized protein (TIGR02246 family)
MTRSFLFPLVFAAIAASCAPQNEAPPDTSADEAAIRQMVEDGAAALAAGDLERFLSYVSNGYEMMLPDAPTVEGMAGVRDFATPLFEQFTMEEPITITDLRVVGDWAVGTYTYVFSLTPKAGGATVSEDGKGIAFFERQADGSWKWTKAVWNRNAPPAAPPATTATRE